MSSDNSGLCSLDLLARYIRQIMCETNLFKRLHLFEELYKRTALVSQPWIQFHIKRTRRKIQEQQELVKEQMDLPF